MQSPAADAWAVASSYGVHFETSGSVVFRRRLKTRLAGVFFVCPWALVCVVCAQTLTHPGNSMELTSAMFRFLVVSTCALIYGLRHVGPHEMSIDLVSGTFRFRTGFFGLKTFDGDNSEIQGFVMKVRKFRTREDCLLYVVWKDSQRLSLPLVSFPHNLIADPVLQEVACTTGLPTEDETW